MSLSTEAIPGWSVGTWTLDPNHTTIGFHVRHLGITTVRGSFTRFAGVITTGTRIEETRASVQIEVDSVHTGQAKRDEHLRTADFLDMAEHPDITFVSDGVINDEEPRMDGQLTIRGVTKPVSLLVELGGIVVDDDGVAHLGFDAEGRIDRTDFGVSWNAVTRAGDVTIGDRVTLRIEAQAVLQA